jgi:hypothetical protein
LVPLRVGCKSGVARARLTVRRIEFKRRVKIPASKTTRSACRGLLFFAFWSLLFIFPVPAQQVHLPARTGEVATISASGAQRRQGSLYFADNDVEITYGACI